MKNTKIRNTDIIPLYIRFIGCDNKKMKRVESDRLQGIFSNHCIKERYPHVCWSDGLNYLSDVYAVKKRNAQEWGGLGVIDKIEFEKGYEYKVKISERNYFDYSMENPAWTNMNYLKCI